MLGAGIGTMALPAQVRGARVGGGPRRENLSSYATGFVVGAVAPGAVSSPGVNPP
jgi:hypothetical protein